jgi:glucosamine kinase
MRWLPIRTIGHDIAMSQPLMLGLDVGGTKTVGVVGDAERELGRGVAPGGNPSVVGVEGFRTAIRSAAQAALESARADHVGARGSNPTRAWLGVAGQVSQAARERLTVEAQATLGIEDVQVSNDAALVLPAAGLHTGVALIVGTGSFATAVGADGRSAAAGGWGYLFGDEGSGYELGRYALRAVSHAADGRGQPTLLTDRVLASLGAQSPADLVDQFYPAPKSSVIASLASLVLDAAAEGDLVATGLVADAAEDLASMVRACARLAGLMTGDDSDPPVPVVMAGGLAVNHPLLSDALARVLGPQAWRVRCLECEPAAGALALARRRPS